MVSRPGRQGRPWRRARTQVLQGQPPCGLCGKAINYMAIPRTRWAPSVDHIIPTSRGGDPTDLANLRAAHYGCNSSRGNRGTKARAPSRVW